MCQYCGCHENTIIARLADEHVRLIDREENSLFPASVVSIIDGDEWARIEADVASARGEPA